jgi:hypothetical protein
MASMIDYIGMDAVIKAVKKQKGFAGIQVRAGATKVPFSTTIDDESEAEAVARLEDYLESRLETNANDNDKLELVLLNEKGKKVVNFIFTLNEGLAVSGTKNNDGTTPSKYMEMNIEFGRLQAENEHLKIENAELNNRILELEAELDEGDEIGATTPMGEVMEMVKPYIPTLIGKLVESFNMPQPQQPMAVNGIADATATGIDEYVNTMMKAGATVNHFSKLADIAKNNPTKFKMLLSML